MVMILNQIIIRRMVDSFQCVSLIETDQLREIINVAGGQKIALIVFGPPMFLLSIFNLAVLIGIKAFRQPPADILIFTNISSSVKLMVIYITMIYDNIYPFSSLPANYHSFCIGTGFFDTMAELSKGIYTIAFCIYYTRKVKNPLKAWTGHNKELHFICILAVFVITFALYLGQVLGPTPYGYCGMKFTNDSSFVSGAVSLTYTIILIIASSIFLRYIRKIQNQNLQTQSYLKYYFCFLLLFCINQLIISACNIVVSYTCSQQIHQNMLNICRIIVTCCQTTSPLFVFIIVMSNEQNRKGTVMQVFRRIRNKVKKFKDKIGQERESNIRTSFINQLNTYRNSLGIQLVQLPDFQSYLGQLKNKNRASLLATILGCISIHQIQLHNYINLNLHMRTSAVQDDQQSLFLWNYSEKSYFELTQSLKQHYHHIFIDKLVTVRMEFIAHAPTILNQFAAIDRVREIGDGLTPVYNYQEILNDCMNSEEGGGGRSGQFFFFNKDRTLILKTVSTTERQVFTQRVKVFHQHFRDNPNSLIVKLYSLFTVNAPDLEEHINFTLMGNILGKVDRKYVLRTYDMKGSTHSRQVMKGQQIEQLQINKTMKDIDFQRLEAKIWVSEAHCAQIIDAIETDSVFFMNNGLIDYSLIVIKVDYTSFVAQNQDHSQILSNLIYYPSSKEKGVVYFVGIIDYLQTWNIRKKGQKWYKSLFNKTEGISSQDPVFYSNRFINFCRAILNP